MFFGKHNGFMKKNLSLLSLQKKNLVLNYPKNNRTKQNRSHHNDDTKIFLRTHIYCT